jgi:hypothetical protein
MKNQLFNVNTARRVFVLLGMIGLLFSVFLAKSATAQVVLKGTVFVYNDAYDESDTTGLITQNPTVLKFYKETSSGTLEYVTSTSVNTDGTYQAVIPSNEELYIVVFGNDEDDNFVNSFYPGYLDFESAETVSAPSGDTIDYDWGAVGKEIVERPSAGVFNVRGKISMQNLSDALPMVYAFQGDMPVSSAIVNIDGSYNLSLSNGEYEIFVSAPGYESQSKFVNSDVTKNVNLNFALDTYRGESSTNNVSVADNYIVSQNYPNPFNPTTSIKYSMPAAGLVKLTVYNMLGKEVATLINRYQESGSYSVEFNGSNLASGVYIYSLTVGNQTVTKKMNLIK